MVPIAVRAFSTVVTVLVGVVVSTAAGDSARAKIVAALVIAAVIAFVEWLLIWAPRHSALARRLLDPRSVMVGTWFQDVARIFHREGEAVSTDENRFAIFWVSYALPDGYRVTGFAYDSAGREFARWHSIGVPEFTTDGHSMSYRFSGTLMHDSDESGADPERTGVSTINVRDGTGRVDHVAGQVSLRFDVSRVTDEWLRQEGMEAFSVKSLRDASARKRFAVAVAATLEPRPTAENR